jgi:type IV pilus assembly protein PilV
MYLTKHLRRLERRSAGFSMIEVLVTMLVVSIGLLGIAKMQAAAVSNTQVARVRSLIALQAGSLASFMHGNPGYWANGPTSFTATGATITDATGVLTVTSPDCASAVCTPAQLAAYDVHYWVDKFNGQFPSYTAAVNCAGTSVTCNITLTWVENYIAINRSTAALTAGQTATQSFTLYVQP